MEREKPYITSPFSHNNKFYFHPKNTHTLVICELLSLNTHLKQKVTYGNHMPNEGKKNPWNVIGQECMEPCDELTN